MWGSILGSGIGAIGSLIGGALEDEDNTPQGGPKMHLNPYAVIGLADILSKKPMLGPRPQLPGQYTNPEGSGEDYVRQLVGARFGQGE